MAYFHIDRTQAYIQSLGFTKATARRSTIAARRSFADAFAPDNSFYSSNDRKLRFGSGGVDDAEDADVIIHEYGHSIQDNQDPGFGCGAGQQFCEAGALGEGFGDYNSAMMTLQIPGLPAPAPGYPTGPASPASSTGTASSAGAAPTERPVRPPGRRQRRRHHIAGRACPGGPCDFGSPGDPSLDIHCVGEVWTHGLLDLRARHRPADRRRRPRVAVLLR